jgi:hypothetical protein
VDVTAQDPHNAPVPAEAWAADADARARGRVQMFNATRPGGLDGWTMDLRQYELLRAHILGVIDERAGAGGAVALQELVETAQRRYAGHPLFPGGRLRNYVTFTKVDLEARGEVERLPGRGAQRVRRAAAPRPGG